jgi:hypothetical protein
MGLRAQRNRKRNDKKGAKERAKGNMLSED